MVIMPHDIDKDEIRERQEKRVLKGLATNGPTGLASAIALRALRNKYPELSRTLPVYGPRKLYPQE